MKTNWFIVLIKWLGRWILPPFLFLIGIELINDLAYNAKTNQEFYCWIIMAYLFLAICLALYWFTMKKLISETDEAFRKG